MIELIHWTAWEFGWHCYPLQRWVPHLHYSVCRDSRSCDHAIFQAVVATAKERHEQHTGRNERQRIESNFPTERRFNLLYQIEPHFPSCLTSESSRICEISLFMTCVIIPPCCLSNIRFTLYVPHRINMHEMRAWRKTEGSRTRKETQRSSYFSNIWRNRDTQSFYGEHVSPEGEEVKDAIAFSSVFQFLLALHLRLLLSVVLFRSETSEIEIHPHHLPFRVTCLNLIISRRGEEQNCRLSLLLPLWLYELSTQLIREGKRKERDFKLMLVTLAPLASKYT